ncbi:MAG: hypothetical protein AB7G87_03840 [Clostridia bacterium]
MKENRIITYSLLAHINDHSSSIKDLGDIFVPLVKRVISKISARGINKGLTDDFKHVFDDMYSLDIPYPILKKIVHKISNEVNQDNPGDFILHDDGSFLLRKHSFSDYEEIIKIQEEEVALLEQAYNEYLKDNEYNVSGNCTIFDFLDKNKMSLSQFFANNDSSLDLQNDEDFIIQAKFVKNIMSDTKIYNVLRKIYLGSIISTYLEANYGKSQDTNVEFLLDTNFIMSILDLHSPESTHTCRKIVHICKQLGYKVSALNFTIEETKALLERTAESNNYSLADMLDPESTFNACERNHYGKTDIQRFAARISNILENEFGINIVTISKYYRQETQKTELYKRLQRRRHNPNGALHDSVAIRYVQERRHINIRYFFEANSWFVTDTKTETPALIKRNGYLPEIIRAEDLVNILWLTHPTSAIKSKELSDMCLTKLIAGTLNNTQPSTRLLKELDENIQKYAKHTVSHEDIARVGIAIANRTVSNLDELNTAGKQGKEQFIKELKAVIDSIKQNEKTDKENMNKIISDYQVKLQSMHDDTESLIAATKENLFAQNKEIIESKRLALDEATNSYEKMKITKNLIDKTSISYAKIHLVIYCIVNMVYFGIIGLLTIKFGWNIMEPVVYFAGVIIVIVNIAYIAITGHDWNVSNLYSHYIDKYTNKLYEENDFNIKEFQSYEERIISLKQEIYEAESSPPQMAVKI